MSIKRGTIFSGKTVPEGLHPNFHKLPRHLLVAEYSNKVNRINQIDRTYRLENPPARERSAVMDRFRFLKNKDCNLTNLDDSGRHEQSTHHHQLPSGLFGSLSDLRNSLNKVDFKKPIKGTAVLPNLTIKKHHQSSLDCNSYSRVLGRLQAMSPDPEPPPNSRLRQ